MYKYCILIFVSGFSVPAVSRNGVRQVWDVVLIWGFPHPNREAVASSESPRRRSSRIAAGHTIFRVRVASPLKTTTARSPP